MQFQPFARIITQIANGHQFEISQRSYAKWIKHNDTITPGDENSIRQSISRMNRRPLISIVMPVFNPDPSLLHDAIASVQSQHYPDWELCIADDASSEDYIGQVISRMPADARIKVVYREENGHISAATNSALALATGDFVAFMDQDDLLPKHALFEVAAEIVTYPDVDILYTDEDKIDGKGRRFEPHFKPDFNPELLLGQNFISHLGVYRRSLIEAVGGLRIGYEGSQDFDLALRASASTTPDRIRHIPAVLYHWRQRGGRKSFSERALTQCADSAQRAIAEHLERTGVRGAKVQSMEGMPAYVRVLRPVPDPLPLVSVIIPTRDHADLLKACVDGLLNRTDYAALEILIVDNGSRDPETLSLLRDLATTSRVRVLRDDAPFNYAALNNRAAAEASGDVLLLLNDDIDVIEPGWLKAMVAQAMRPGVGAVGARLLYKDGTIQHAGVVLGVGGDPAVAGHLHVGAPRTYPGHFGHLFLARDTSAVTAACMALRRDVFMQAGGFDAEALQIAFNDVDLCLKIRALGYRIVWTPLAELYHYESASRGSDLTPAKIERFNQEIATMRQRWGAVLDADPFYGPNFDRMGSHYNLAPTSRRIRPWRALQADARH